MQALKKSFFGFFSIFLLIILVILIDITLTYVKHLRKESFINHSVYHHTFGKNKVFYKNGIKYIY